MNFRGFQPWAIEHVFHREEVGDVRSMLLKLRRVLQEVKIWNLDEPDILFLRGRWTEFFKQLKSYFFFIVFFTVLCINASALGNNLLFADLVGCSWFAAHYFTKCFQDFWTRSDCPCLKLLLYYEWYAVREIVAHSGLRSKGCCFGGWRSKMGFEAQCIVRRLGMD